MTAITDYESGRLLEFFKNHPDNEKKLISIAKTITKNTLTHLTLNGKNGNESLKQNKYLVLLNSFLNDT